MNKKNIILSLFIGTLLTFVMPLCAQNQTVTGLVVDVSGEPIIGATVMVVNVYPPKFLIPLQLLGRTTVTVHKVIDAATLLVPTVIKHC